MTVREALGETWRWYVDKPLDDWHADVAGAARAAGAGLVARVGAGNRW